jgi:hypothetical protein
MRLVTLVCAVSLLWSQGRASRPHPGEIPKREGPLLVAMATCESAGCVKATYAKMAGPDIVARVVYFTNLLRLNPGDRVAARGLLQNIPRTGRQDARLIVLSTNMYPGETDAEIRAVGRAYWNFSRNLAHGLRLHPEFLPSFIRYGTIALSPHSTYPNWATQVCRANPGRFLRAFETLSAQDRRYIAKYVIQPKGCKQVAFPEAE